MDPHVIRLFPKDCTWINVNVFNNISFSPVPPMLIITNLILKIILDISNLLNIIATCIFFDYMNFRQLFNDIPKFSKNFYSIEKVERKNTTSSNLDCRFG